MLGLSLLVASSEAVAQHLITPGDLIFSTTNAWGVFTNPSQQKLIIQPLIDNPNYPTAWSPVDGNWNKSTVFMRTGDVQFNTRVGIGVDMETPTVLIPGAQTKLAVEGTISARGIRVVGIGTPWPDYVFASTYALRPLGEVASFIAAHHHLPDMPSAAEVQKEGLDLGAMDARLLRKVEELTLYLLRLEEENKALRARMSALETTSCR